MAPSCGDNIGGTAWTSRAAAACVHINMHGCPKLAIGAAGTAAPPAGAPPSTPAARGCPGRPSSAQQAQQAQQDWSAAELHLPGLASCAWS